MDRTDQERDFAGVARFAAVLATVPAVSDVLLGLAQCAADAVAVRSTGVSLVRGGELHPAGMLDRMAAEVGRVQAEARCGPCAEALRTARPVTVPDLARDAARWPGYGERVLGLGVAATASLPLHSKGKALGTLGLYHTAPRPWPAADLRRVRVLTDMAVAYLALAADRDHQRRVADQLRHALDSRVVIEQAKGMLAAERRIPTGEAFELLRGYARHHRARLRDTAEAVVEEGLRP
ncbi:transcriptional regulator [Streptomyces sp. Ru73]|uniref:GAF and ANTAR domain-containing protein n=1 Tax=Streptomyces sp. Ru73 TaxID=2080748 RepID=UPI000CDD0C3C|nr:GAF and ANTAR domain-containing protein [Streptomyces sp. Ru73]POX36083.1 transcriptional regulator [Streptomyces sp. Ru73]